MSAKVALELLTDERTRGQVSDLKEAFKAYPLTENPKERSAKSQHSKNQGYILAAILHALASTVERGLPVQSEEEASISQNKALLALSKATGQKMPEYPSPLEIKLPSLGPHANVDEHLVEKYNRAYCLLRGFSQILEPGRWTSKISGPEATPFESTLVDPSYVPLWMVQVDTASAAAGIPKRSPTRVLEPKMTILSWDRDPKYKPMQAVDQHINDFIGPGHLRSILPYDPVPALKDPRVYPNGAMWRDTVRRQLSFDRLRLDFLSLILEDEGKEMVIHSDVVPAKSWEHIREQLCKSNREVKIQYTVKPLEEDEDFEIEWTGPPVALLADIRLGDDNDVEAIPPDTKQDELLNAQMSFEDQELAENKAFLSGGGHSLTRGPPKPETEFSNATEEKRIEMLYRHDGFDVLTPDGLKAWQAHVYGTICSNVPKEKTQPSF